VSASVPGSSVGCGSVDRAVSSCGVGAFRLATFGGGFAAGAALGLAAALGVGLAVGLGVAGAAAALSGWGEATAAGA
jgi:hypothetical protein